MKYSVTKPFDFCAAHRLEGHPKCGRLHGHNYLVEVTLHSDTLVDGMVMDFGDIKEVVNPIIGHWDHRYLVSQDNLENNCPYQKVAPIVDTISLPMQESTAESMAHYIAERIAIAGLPPHIGAVTVVVKETPKSVATYSQKVTGFTRQF